MILSLSSTAFAANVNVININDLPNAYMGEIEDGNIFIQKTDTKTVVILTSDVEHFISISIEYTDMPDTVYKWTFDNYPVSIFSPNSYSFWTGIVEYAEGNIAQASIISFEYSTSDLPITRSSAGADLQEDMAELLCQPYSNKYIQVKVIQGHVYRLYETLEFSIRKSSGLSWKEAVALSSLILKILGVVTATPYISVFASILGVVPKAATVISPGKINKYDCMSQYYRYITIDGSEREYSYAYKFINYDGYEDADLNSTGRAHIIADTEFIHCATTEEYFNNGLFDEAYNAYYNIGV